jgi:RNA polymerase sigma factor (sigma-70 family)
MNERVGSGLFGFERELHVRALSLTGSDEDASDLVQDTFERALRSWHRLKPGTDVRGWLLRVLHGVHAGHHEDSVTASYEHLPRAALVADEPLPVPQWRLYTMRDVTAAYHSLPAPLSEVYRLRVLRGRPPAEVVERLHIPAPAADDLLLRAVTRLRATLKARGPAVHL